MTVQKETASGQTTISPWRWVVFGSALGLALGSLVANFAGPPKNPILVPVAFITGGASILVSGFLRRFR